MPQRHTPTASYGQYLPGHISGTGTSVGIGACMDDTSATTIAPGSVQVTLNGNGAASAAANAAKLSIGQRLIIAGGTGTAEIVTITAIDQPNGKFTATFANAHSAAYHIMTRRGTFVGPLIVNKVGTGETLTIYNGSPNATAFDANIGKVVAVITPNANKDQNFQLALDYGLFYTLGGTPGDYTFQYADMANDIV